MGLTGWQHPMAFSLFLVVKTTAMVIIIVIIISTWSASSIIIYIIIVIAISGIHHILVSKLFLSLRTASAFCVCWGQLFKTLDSIIYTPFLHQNIHS